ncbi:MAG: hypothetical protein QOJ51_676, partial [Acidobacteriaceae bacterium]|nr:hypothetical protein [Acidobacteriaceae bacterium]
RVRVIRGSLQGVEGILVRKKNQFRLVLSVEMLAKSVAVEIAASDVEPVAGRVHAVQTADSFYGALPLGGASPAGSRGSLRVS